MKYSEQLMKLKRKIEEREKEKIRSEERIKNLEKNIANISEDVRELGCEPTSKAMKSRIQSLQEEIDSDLQKLIELLEEEDNEEENDL